MEGPPPWSRADTVLALVLGGLGLATRFALRGHGLHSWDSGLLAAGIVSYDFAASQPHPPYYPLTIGLGKLLAPWLGPVDALTALAVLSSAATAALAFAVARRLTGRLAAAGAAGVVLLSPLMLFNGIVPLSYALEGASGTAIAWAAWQARAEPRPARWVALAVAASVAAGIRPSSLILFPPIVAWALAWRLRAWAWTLAAGGLATLAWGLPAVAAGGGWADLRLGLGYQSAAYVLSNPAWEGGASAVAGNLGALRAAAASEMPFFAAAGALALAGALAVRRHAAPLGGAFLAAWALPGLLFYLLVYAGWPIFPSGYLAGLVPAAAVACAVGLAGVLRGVRDPLVPPAARAIGSAVVLVVAAMPAGWLLEWDDVADARQAPEAWWASWDGLEQAFPPNASAILTFYGSTWVRLHHPDHLAWHVQPFRDADGLTELQVQEDRHGRTREPFFHNVRDGRQVHPIPDWVQRIVVVEGHPLDDLPPVLRDGLPTRQVTLPGGATARYVEPAPGTLVEDLVRWFPDDRPRWEPPD